MSETRGGGKKKGRQRKKFRFKKVQIHQYEIETLLLCICRKTAYVTAIQNCIMMSSKTGHFRCCHWPLNKTIFLWW